LRTSWSVTRGSDTAEKQVAKEHEISDTLRNKFGGDLRRSVTLLLGSLSKVRERKFTSHPEIFQ
jgi:hypothetical protein